MGELIVPAVTAQVIAEFVSAGEASGGGERVALWATAEGLRVQSGDSSPVGATAYLMPWDPVWWAQFNGDAQAAADHLNQLLPIAPDDQNAERVKQ